MIGEKGIGGDAGVTAVAVGEEVDPDKAVMETRRRLERREGRPLGPEPGIVQQHAQLHTDLRRGDADVRLGAAKMPGPGPGLAEQAAMELAHAVLGQDVRATAPGKPEKTALDIGLLQLVELAAGRDVAEAQARPVVGIERRRAVRLRAEGCHGPVQKSGGIVRASSRARRSASARFVASGRPWRSSAMWSLARPTSARALRRAWARMASSTRPTAGTMA
jgi:hypothetical protein